MTFLDGTLPFGVQGRSLYQVAFYWRNLLLSPSPRQKYHLRLCQLDWIIWPFSSVPACSGKPWQFSMNHMGLVGSDFPCGLKITLLISFLATSWLERWVYRRTWWEEHRTWYQGHLYFHFIAPLPTLQPNWVTPSVHTHTISSSIPSSRLFLSEPCSIFFRCLSFGPHPSKPRLYVIFSKKAL